MHRNKKTIAPVLLIFCFLVLGSAFSAAQDSAAQDDKAPSAAKAPGEEVQVDGMITGRTGDTMNVKNRDGVKTVVITDETKTKDNKGLLGIRKEEMSNVVLIPGLKVQVDGVSDQQGRVTAKTITVDGDDLETAQMIQAGLHPTGEQVAKNVATLQSHEQNIASNQQNIASNAQKIEQNMQDVQQNTDRFSSLKDFDVKGQATLNFKPNSTSLTPADQQELKKLAQAANSMPQYLIEIKGYADSTGDAKMNTKLSEERAKAAVAYLVQQANVPVRRIVAPGAMGEYGPKASNETPSGRAENRRVEVKVLVNKGVNGKS